MKNILLVVDIQNGFISNEMTRTALSRIENLLQAGAFDAVIATKYRNYPGSPISRLMGWDLLTTDEEQELAGSVETYADRVVEKSHYSAVNDNLIQALTELNEGTLPEYLFVAGVDTECCVLSSAADLFEKGIRPIVLSAYCGSSGGESFHHAGIVTLRRLIGENNICCREIRSRSDIEDIVREIHFAPKPVVFPSETKEEKLVHILTERGLHIAFAESCTGGLAAARLINVASASGVIDGSIVTYANEIKTKYVHVPEEMIRDYGVVSEEVASAMARGIVREMNCETGVGISGIAGPGGATPGKPVGMVCFGFVIGDEAWSRTRYFGNIGRNEVRRASVEFVYDELLAHLTKR